LAAKVVNHKRADLQSARVVEIACAQKLKRLPDGFGIAHDERVRRVNVKVIGDAD
jgi:hypothetical protein